MFILEYTIVTDGLLSFVFFFLNLQIIYIDIFVYLILHIAPNFMTFFVRNEDSHNHKLFFLFSLLLLFCYRFDWDGMMLELITRTSRNGPKEVEPMEVSDSKLSSNMQPMLVTECSMLLILLVRTVN